MSKKSLDMSALLSVLVCAVLVLIGAVRVMSYSRDTLLAEVAKWPVLTYAAYQPGNYVNAQYFKIVATPSVIAGIYFFIRLRNRSYRRMSPLSYDTHGGRIDFRSPWLRLVLTSVISLHWVAMEMVKYYADDFYPFSSLESTPVNALVLLASGIIALWGMKYLSFEPLYRDHVCSNSSDARRDRR
jgi:hypothetical protein